MILYHFTSERHIQRVRNEGITMGVVLTSLNPIAARQGIQWLTSNPDRLQSWKREGSRLPYDRTAFRITVEIPLTDERLRRWLTAGPHLCDVDTVSVLNAFGDPENWWIYFGPIPPTWFRVIDDMRVAQDQGLTHGGFL